MLFSPWLLQSPEKQATRVRGLHFILQQFRVYGRVVLGVDKEGGSSEHELEVVVQGSMDQAPSV